MAKKIYTHIICKIENWKKINFRLIDRISFDVYYYNYLLLLLLLEIKFYI